MLLKTPYPVSCLQSDLAKMFIFHTVEFLLGEKKERSEWRAIDNVANMKQSLAVSHHLSVDDITLSYNGGALIRVYIPLKFSHP